MWILTNFAKYAIHITPEKTILVECYKMLDSEDKKSIQFISPKSNTSFIVREGWIDGIMEIVAEFERDNIIGFELVQSLGLHPDDSG